MYLINKDETEHTGQVRHVKMFKTDKHKKRSKYNRHVYVWQESYVWKMYQERCWDFFPAGDCFRKQYEDQLG